MIGGCEEVDVNQQGSAPGEPVCLQVAGVPMGAAQTQLFERRSIIIATPVGLSGDPAKPYIVAGHSGADHPLGCGAAEPSVSFGEDPDAHQLQLGQKGECLLHRECTGVRFEEKGQAGLAKPLLFTPGGTPRESETLTSASDSVYLWH